MSIWFKLLCTAIIIAMTALGFELFLIETGGIESAARKITTGVWVVAIMVGVISVVAIIWT